MLTLSNTFARSQLLLGTSDWVTDLNVDDVQVGWAREVVVKLMFRRGVPIDQAVADRDRVRDNYLRAMTSLANDAEAPDLYFVLDEEPALSSEEPANPVQR